MRMLTTNSPLAGGASERRPALGIRSRRFASLLFFGLANPSCWVQPLQAQPANEPLDNFVVTDGAVYALAKTNNVLYFGGLFTSVGPRTGSGVPVSAATGLPEAAYPSINGDTYIAVGDGQGGWFVGGLFTLVGGQLRTNLVHIRSDRTVDPNWVPTAAGGWVGSMCLAGNTLYLGGTFTNINGQARNRLAALDVASGGVTAWNPNANGTIRGIVLSGTNVYVGGEFTTVGPQTRTYLAAVDTTNGLLTAWNPGPNNIVRAMVLSGSHLYVGGSFSAFGAPGRSCAASFDATTGLLEAWNPNIGTASLVSPSVSALAAYQDKILSAGISEEWAIATGLASRPWTQPADWRRAGMPGSRW